MVSPPHMNNGPLSLPHLGHSLQGRDLGRQVCHLLVFELPHVLQLPVEGSESFVLLSGIRQCGLKWEGQGRQEI